MTLGTLLQDKLHLVLITGMSGAGKSVALRALEDASYFCVDNLPPELIMQLLQTLEQQDNKRSHLAIAIDGRVATSLHLLPALYRQLQSQGINLNLIYLDASDDALIRRFSETRRRHPLSELIDTENNSNQRIALKEAITHERKLLAELRELGGAVIDSSLLRPAQLQSWVKETIKAPWNTLTLVFESFAFKKGIPVDADYVFDIRILPNPYYIPELKHLTGKDEAIQKWLTGFEEVIHMQKQIYCFLDEWLPKFVDNHRSYLTVAIGCTGGQHRSVYFVEALSHAFSQDWQTIARHRELDI